MLNVKEWKKIIQTLNRKLLWLYYQYQTKDLREKVLLEEKGRFVINTLLNRNSLTTLNNNDPKSSNVSFKLHEV